MKLKTLFLLCLLFNWTFTFSQREAAIWYFGEKAGLDFNSGSPVALTDGKLVTSEGCATISDYNGKLLFYTDGSNVWNAKHEIMPNGTGLLGHKSSTQSAIIVPKPEDPSIYYIFTIDEPNNANADDDPITTSDDGVNDGLNYTEVNMTLNGGLGDVNPLKKNIHLITYNPNNKEESAFKASEKITAVQHENGEFYWVISHFIDKYYAFLVTDLGVQSNSVISTTNITVPLGGYFPNAIGYLKSSPNGKKLGIVHMSTKSTNIKGPKGQIIRNSGMVLLYDFNNSTGVISNQISLLRSVNPYGLEFSSKTKKVYVTANNYMSDGATPKGSSLYQFNLESTNIPNSKKLIIENDYIAGALQLAIDEKIYRSGYKILSENFSLSVINKPEANGTSCDFVKDAVSLGGKEVLKGLPPFIQSLFLFNFKYEFKCLGDSTHFSIITLETIDSVLWDFGDGSTSTDLEAFHTFQAAGTYLVSLTKTINGEDKEPIIKEVIIKEKPVILKSTYQLTQCDSYDSNPNDELANFNLAGCINAITLNNSENYDVFFYLNDVDADSDVSNQNSLPEIYKNIIPNQQITVKVLEKESDCYDLGKVELIANPSIILKVKDMIGCDLGDATAEFNLVLKKNDIIQNLGLPDNLTFSFFGSEEDAQNHIPLSNTIISSEKLIYFSAQNEGVCYGSGTFNLNISSFPNIEPEEILAICEGDFPFNLMVPIPQDIQQNYNYLWSTGEVSTSIYLLKEQDVTLKITDKSTGCEKTIVYHILKVKPPIILNTSIDLDDNFLSIMTNNNDENLFALDYAFGEYQSNPFFTNVSPGIHTIYVQNSYKCDVAIKKIFVLGFPKFFTPNNDGFNDVWEAKGLDFEGFAFSDIAIFNRFGKHLITIKPNASWNGFYKGKFLPSTDFWYHISVTDINGVKETYRGHFSLIR